MNLSYNQDYTEKFLILSEEEILQRINLNYNRLCEPYYQFEQVFSPPDYDWYGDKEGRCLLAFACHIKLGGRAFDCLGKMLGALDSHTNEGDYFGPLADDLIHEQQLSGHSWYLRGLCELYEIYKDSENLRRLKNVFEGLYLPTKNRYSSYPLNRPFDDGDVSGHSNVVLNGWQLSSDVGCAFMSVDGLSHYYVVTKDERALSLLDEMIEKFISIDIVALKAQTHCSLTAARGMLRLFDETANKKYLEGAQKIFKIYLESGITYTYQNFNWWGRGNTWTEPCAIVDSLIVALHLYEITANFEYLQYARRIWHNGMASSQRSNGGAGTDTTVSATCDILHAQMEEAYFCCTMRLAEGLLWAFEKRELLTAELSGELKQDEFGRFFNGDIMYGEIITKPPADLPELSYGVTVPEGYFLTPLVKFYRLKTEEVMSIKQRVVFPIRNN